MESPLFSEKVTLPLESQTQCFNVQLLWNCDCRKWVIFMKTRILQWKLLNFRGLGNGD